FRDQGKEREELEREELEQKRTTNCEKQTVGCLRNARAWERSLAALAARDDSKFEASFAFSLSGVQATRLPLQALSRVKGCASRGGESGVEHDHDYEHEHEHNARFLLQRQLILTFTCLALAFLCSSAVTLPHPCPTFSTIAAKSAALFLKGRAWLFPSLRRVRESRA